MEDSNANGTAAAAEDAGSLTQTPLTQPPPSESSPSPPTTKDSATASQSGLAVSTLASPSFSSSSYSGGFFSLGESNLADRARKLKLEQEASNGTRTKTSSSSHNDDTVKPQVDAVAKEGQEQKEDGEETLSSNDVSTKEHFEDTVVGDIHEFDSLYIYNQIDEKDNALYKSLAAGFKGLKVMRDDFFNDSSVQELQTNNRRQYSATVNFIDPTTTSNPSSSPSSASSATSSTASISAHTNMLQQQSRLQKQESGTSASNSIENVYEKITHIFERDYRSTLRSVQYKNLRTGEMEYISSLPINPVITRTGIATDSKTNKTVNAPWGGTSSTSIVPVNDPAEWHTGPFCHVYVAACKNIDHYQSKVKPALQAFVSQIESASSNTAANQQGGHSADYLIVYIPVGGGASASNIKDSLLDANNARKGIFQRARKRWTVGGAGVTDDEDAKSNGSVDSGGGGGGGDAQDTTDLDDPDAIAMSVALNLLSKSEQKVYKKILADFPNGKACVLSTISLDRSNDAMANPDGVAIRTQEWNTFNRMLGAVVVKGFSDRCRRYKEELKRLDAQRAIAATAAKNSQGEGFGSSNNSKQKANPYAFNLGHFFLVKESLAFTYEQMQLPGESLLQYDEFRLYMPDLSDKEERKVRRARRKSKALREVDKTPSLTEMADSGDFLGFRKKIRTEYDLTAVLDVMRRYLFAREISLLFRMEEPVELLNRCQAFVKTMYTIMVRGINDLSNDDERNLRQSKAYMWIVQFAWDIKTASDPYFRSSGDSADDRSVGSLGSGMDSSIHRIADKTDEAVAAKISELLDISLAVFMKLGDTELTGSNPLRSLLQEMPADLEQEWPTWIPPVDALPEDGSDFRRKSLTSRNRSTDRQFLLGNSFSSTERFERTFLDLCEAIIKMSRKAKRRRLAARLQAEVGEFFVRSGRLSSAIPIFKQALKRYRLDQWDRSHFWRLFRLAYCQRTVSKPTEYLKTLVSSFSPRIAAVAPAKALCALQDDLEMVLRHPSVGDARYGKLSFFDTSLRVSKMKNNRVTVGKGQDRKDMIKHFSVVGETINIEVTVKSFLPSSVKIDSAKLFIVSFQDFLDVLETNTSIEEEQAIKILQVGSELQLEPGTNTFSIDWSPNGTGQYVLFTIEMIWNQGYFYYDSLDLPDPVFGIDVLPSEPTHSIVISPESLLPGHDQELTITIDARDDIISSANLLLSCFKGASLLPPGHPLGSTEWRNECEVEIPQMMPGDQHKVQAYYRCTLDEQCSGMEVSPEDSTKISSGVSAKLRSLYIKPRDGQNDAKELVSMKTVLETFAPVLEHNALSIESTEIHWLQSFHRFLLNVVLTSNTPYRYCLESCTLELPHPFAVVNELMLNEGISERRVLERDHLSFAFDCRIADTSAQALAASKAPCLQLNLRDDAGKALSLNLGLSLDLSEAMSDIKASNFVQRKVSLLAVLELSSVMGRVGQPVVMTYTVDLTRIADLGDGFKTVYHVSGDGSTWIVAGRVKGIFTPGCTEKEGNGTCQVVGTPLASGLLDDFPKIAIALVAPNGDQVPLPLEIRHPEKFEAISRMDGIAIAAPSSS